MEISRLVEESLSCSWAVATGALLLAIGLLHVVKVSYDISRFLFRFLLPPVTFKRFGKWVVVTGATDGIGKAYCAEFAESGKQPLSKRQPTWYLSISGLNVCLLSRTESRLTEVSEELRTKYGVETKQVAVDFSKVSEEKWGEIRELLGSLEVGILVNNVGCSYDHYEYFHAIDDATIDRLIEINIRATVQMTRCVLSGMLARKKGVVLNVGSGVGSLLPSSPLLAVYAGSKAFVEQFTKSCAIEYKNEGILFQDQAPLFVATKMSKIRSVIAGILAFWMSGYRRSSLTVPSPQTWVKGALQQVGNGSLTSGYWIHNIMWAVMNSIPSALLDSYVFSSGKVMRAKALKKKSATKKDS